MTAQARRLYDWMRNCKRNLPPNKLVEPHFEAIPRQVNEVIGHLEANGFQGWLVGGAVRNLLLGERPQDFDLSTDARPEQVQTLFERLPQRAVGLSHGTVMIVAGGLPLEITTFRQEAAYSDGRHPDTVHFLSDLTQDLARRDFTVNALAWCPAQGLRDPFDGRGDLERRVLRTVGRPAARLQEDALRILRALRFAAVLTLNIEPRTARALLQSYENLQALPVERIWQELSKFLTSPLLLPELDLFGEIICSVMPEFLTLHRDEKLLKSPAAACAADQADAVPPDQPLSRLQAVWLQVALSNRDPVSRLAALFWPAQPVELLSKGTEPAAAAVPTNEPVQRQAIDSAHRALTRLKAATRLRQQVGELLRLTHLEIVPDRQALKQILSKIGAEQLQRLMTVQTAVHFVNATENGADPRLNDLADSRRLLEDILAAGDAYRLDQLAVRGHDLLALGCPPGRKLGEILQQLLQAVVADELPNERGTLLRWLKNQLDQSGLTDVADGVRVEDEIF